MREKKKQRNYSTLQSKKFAMILSVHGCVMYQQLNHTTMSLHCTGPTSHLLSEVKAATNRTTNSTSQIRGKGRREGKEGLTLG